MQINKENNKLDALSYNFPDGSTSLQSPEELKNDAIMMDFKPGNVVINSNGSVVQIASWPYHDEPDAAERYRGARVKVRSQPGDPTSLVETNYYSLIRLLEEGSL